MSRTSPSLCLPWTRRGPRAADQDQQPPVWWNHQRSCREGVLTAATYDEKLALMRCLFALSATDETISTAEEGEIHRIANELRSDPPDLIALRVAHQRYLPGLSAGAVRRRRPASAWTASRGVLVCIRCARI